MLDIVRELFVSAHTSLFENLVQPVLFQLGLAEYLEIAYSGTEWFLLGVIELAVLFMLLRPLEALWPAEIWQDRRAVRVDVLYSVLNRLGVVPLFVFTLLAIPLASLDGWLRMHDWIPRQLEDWLPGLNGHPVASFLLYLLIIDFAEYWRHRLQHALPAWWALHAVHHSQRQLSFWSDNRNHLLDELIAGVWLATIGLLVGMPPGQFVLAVIALRAVESLAHANTRLHLGRIGEKLLVGPRFHRVHHGIDFAQVGRSHGVNFAVILPLWDVIFRTADFRSALQPTGIDDQLQGREYGEGFLRQQVLGLKRMAASLTGRAA
ncbi:MAG: hypothetical protein RIR70_1105 [Pseudomonadota bacterium]|jgi:sterol desaturase/sphingolipid hydroxylase (fatty acid hydroxylase superfamily)